MSMLKCIFELDGNKELFQGLEIMEEQELCEEYMGKFLVISLSLKDIDAESYETAFSIAAMLVNEEVGRHYYLLESEKLTCNERKAFSELLDRKMEQPVFSRSLKLLSQLLEKHHGQKVVILMDEYDVPLAKAHARGYYGEMISLIQSLFHQTFKTNSSMQFAVLTGCMRITKDGNAKFAQKQLRKYLKKTISIRDTFARKELKENFYHGMLLGLLAFKGSWAVFSNREAGEGYADIIVEIDDDDEPMGIVIEVKYARDGNLDAACQEALGQIEKRQYGDVFEDEDIIKVLKYGIACYKDKCRIMLSAVNQIADSKES